MRSAILSTVQFWVKVMYKWNAEDYHKNSFNQQKWARDLIAKLDPKGNERILDIGCGERKVTAEIATYVANGSVIGIDSSEEIIDLARQKFPPNHFPNLAFQCADAKKLSL